MKEYVYHFSDNINHNWAHSGTVIVDLINNYFTQSDIVRIKSDNCRNQYKCKYVFGHYRQLAMKLLKKLIIYYGTSGHGRALVDGMAAFGVKTPLRKEIINHDFWWTKASTLVQFFNERENDSQSENKLVFKEITDDDIHNTTPKVAPVLCLPLHIKQHCMVFNSDDTVLRCLDLCHCDDCLQGKINKCKADGSHEAALNEEVEEEEDDKEEEDIDEDDRDEDVVDEDDNDYHIEWKEILQKGSVIALRTPCNEKESFYLCIVDKVKVAEDKVYDSYGHHILKGMEYFECNYLSMQSEKRKEYIQYKKLSGVVCVLPGEAGSKICLCGRNDLSLPRILCGANDRPTNKFVQLQPCKLE